MGKYCKNPLLSLILLFLFLDFAKAEGTLELEPTTRNGYTTKFQIGDDQISNIANYNSPADKRLYIHIANPSTEKIYLGFGQMFTGNTISGFSTTCFYRIKNPNGTIISASQPIPTSGVGYINNKIQATSPPFGLSGGGGGYIPIIVNPTANLPGDYYIEFSQDGTENSTKNVRFEFIDITVGSENNSTKGRLWSKMWSLVTLAANNQSESKFYIYTKDSVVTSFNMNGMQPFGFGVMSNALGTNTSTNFLFSRQSDKTNPAQNRAYPEYKIFLNNPDEKVYPSYITKLFLNSSYYNGCNTNTTCAGISINMSKGATAEILLDLNNIPEFQPNTEDVFITATLVAGDNCVPWNGRDGKGVRVASNRTIDMTARLSNGLSNFPIYDPETNPVGLIVNLVRPLKPSQDPNNLPILPVFWDDTKVGGTASPTSGCVLSTGCHTWNTNFGNEVTMNSWWYGSDTIITTKLLIDPYPLANAYAGVDKFQCLITDVVDIGFTIAGSNPKYNYLWKPISVKGNSLALAVPTDSVTKLDLKKIPGLNPTDSLSYELIVDNFGCIARDTMKVYIRGAGSIEIFGKTDVCPNSKSVAYWINKRPDITSVTWNNFVNSSQSTKIALSTDTVYVDFSSTAPSTASFKANATSNCPIPEVTRQVNIVSVPKGDPPIGKTRLCYKTENVQVYKVTPVAGSTYKWEVELDKGSIVGATNGATVQIDWSPTIIDIGGKVQVTQTYTLPDGFLCSSVVTPLTVVGLDPIKPIKLSDLEVCNNIPITAEFKETAPSTSPSTFIWQPNTGFQNGTTSSSPSIRLRTLNGDTIKYKMTVIREGCVHRDSFNLAVKPDARIENISGPNPVCTDAIGTTYVVKDTFATSPTTSRAWAVSAAKTFNVVPTDRNKSVTVDWAKSKINAYVAVKSPSAFGCKDAFDTIRIDIISYPSYKPKYDSVICETAPVTWPFKAGGDNGGTIYNWIFKADDLSTTTTAPVKVNPFQDSVNVTFPKKGLYYLSLKQSGGGLNFGENCLNPPDTLKINVFDELSIKTNPDTTICLKDTATLYVMNNRTVPFKWYAQTSPNTETLIPELKVSPSTPNKQYTYWVKLANPKCKAVDTVKVTVNPLPKPPLNKKELEFCFEDNALLTLDGPAGLSKYEWQPMNEATPSVDVAYTIFTDDLQKQYVSLKVQDLNGCFNKDSILLKAICDPRLELPKVFSPNDDGYNDTMQVFGAHFKNYKIRIFNRWGEVIFESQDRNKLWDGTYKGLPVPAGVFPWTVSYESLREKDRLNPREKKGSITVVR